VHVRSEWTIRWRVATATWMVVMFVGAILPQVPSPRLGSLRPLDGPGGHIVASGILTALLQTQLPDARALGLAWMYGAVLEGAQRFISYRSAELVDLLMNAIGVLAAWIIVLAWRHRSVHPGRPLRP
jgi:hypothetical protein